MSKNHLVFENKKNVPANVMIENETVAVHSSRKPSLPDVVVKRNNGNTQQPKVRRPSSITSRKLNISVISEEVEDEVPRTFTRNNSTMGSNNSYVRKDVSRSHSHLNGIGRDNVAFAHSTESSLRGSVKSLPVIREQYCCCQRWTRLERTLLKAIALLAIVILALVIAVGLLAKHREHLYNKTGATQKLMWSL